MADLGEEVKSRLGQVRCHPVPLGRVQDAVSFSPDEGRGLRSPRRQGGDLGQGANLEVPGQTWRNARRRWISR